MHFSEEPLEFPLPRIGGDTEGYIVIATMGSTIPFRAERVYWVCGTAHVPRGGHAHLVTRQVLVGVAGSVRVTTELPDGRTRHFVLDDPSKALYLPVMCWRTMQFEQGGVLLVMASTPFDHGDYIRDLQHFRELGRRQ